MRVLFFKNVVDQLAHIYFSHGDSINETSSNKRDVYAEHLKRNKRLYWKQSDLDNQIVGILLIHSSFTEEENYDHQLLRNILLKFRLATIFIEFPPLSSITQENTTHLTNLTKGILLYTLHLQLWDMLTSSFCVVNFFVTERSNNKIAPKYEEIKILLYDDFIAEMECYKSKLTETLTTMSSNKDNAPITSYSKIKKKRNLQTATNKTAILDGNVESSHLLSSIDNKTCQRIINRLGKIIYSTNHTDDCLSITLRRIQQNR